MSWLRRFYWPLPKQVIPRLMSEFLEELRTLKPGRVITIVGFEGQRVAVLDYEDFVFILERAGMHGNSAITLVKADDQGRGKSS